MSILPIWSCVSDQIIVNLYLSELLSKCLYSILSGGADCCIKIWSAETGDCPVTFKGHTGPIAEVCIVDRGRNIISVSKYVCLFFTNIVQLTTIVLLLFLGTEVLDYGIVGKQSALQLFFLVNRQ